MNTEHDHDDEGGDDDDDDSLEIPVSFCLLALMTLFCFTNNCVKCSSLGVK